MDKLWTISEVAEYLKVKVDTVNKWVQRGLIKSIKVGGVVRIFENDLKDFISKER